MQKMFVREKPAAQFNKQTYIVTLTLFVNDFSYRYSINECE